MACPFLRPPRKGQAMQKYEINGKAGWVKLHRCFLEHPIFTSGDIHLLKLAIYILLKVNHRENRILFAGKEMTIPAGSGIFGIDQIVRDLTGLERKKSKKYRKFRTLYYRKLQILKKVGFLKLNPYNKFTVISIVNWEKYQAKSEKCNKNVTQVKLSCDSNVTKQEVYKNVKNEKETATATETDVAAVVSPIFRGAVKTETLREEIEKIQNKDTDYLIRTARYCQEKNGATNPVGLYFTMIRQGTEPPTRATNRSPQPNIPPPAGGYQTDEGPLVDDQVDKEDEPEKIAVEEKEGEEESDEEFERRMERDKQKLKELCKGGNLGDPLYRQLERLKTRRPQK